MKSKVEEKTGFPKAEVDVRRTQEELLQSEEKYRTLIENMQEGVFIIQDSKLQFVNDFFAKSAGYTVEECIGKDFREFVAPEDLDMVVDRYYRLLAGEDIHKECELCMLHKDMNTKIFVNMNLRLITYRGNTASMGTVKDITESKKAQELRLENNCLALASKTKSDFLANMSHELRTPLNAIIGFSELMKQRVPGELNKKQENYVDDILTSANHLNELINDILDLSKAEAGKTELVPEKLPVHQAINEGLTLVKEKAMNQKVKLNVELGPGLEFIVADKQRFKQILFNLLSNAVKFSKPEGGEVTVNAVKANDMAQISVSDTGIGIKEEDLGKLFRTFQQLDMSMSRKYGGTGLGLAITKQLVELHGGRIWAESRYGEGSTFTFLLPTAAKNEPIYMAGFTKKSE
ncbi:MAG: PAS domain-containing sensor histidine kinase [Candidatus Methanoperedens sp.]|nr:PAS domain-containing sensor histidine kinase [Candidatus Methanoperedens sp.]MCZ7406176.1 PAS domain-containing sensor histidine kinase [Candidatus Methanoperedens sp.]